VRLVLSAPAPYNEKRLLAAIAGGDQAAFRELFRRWHQLLAGYVLKITESRELTEEIVQDVFMKIWTMREPMTEINNFKHFLLVVSRNKAFDHMREQLKEASHRRAWEKENAPPLHHTDNELEIFRLSLIEQAIANLPPRRKDIFLLSRGERLTYQVIASRLDISRESVKTHLRLASLAISGFVRSKLGEVAFLALLFSKIF